MPEKGADPKGRSGAAETDCEGDGIKDGAGKEMTLR